MTHDQFIALGLFALASSLTPGPNNLMLLASGANFGFRRSLPHIFGIGFGFVGLVVLTGVGLQRVFETWPLSHTILQGLSVVYLTWLAWKISQAEPRFDGQGTPMTFLQAAAFQWVNPKGWAMAITANTVYAATHSFQSVLLVALVFGVINVPSVSLWAFLGTRIARLLRTKATLRLFNMALALLLMASLIPLLRG